VACDGKDVKSVDQLDACLGRHSLGDKVKLKAQTRGGEKEVEVTLLQDPRVEVVTDEHLGKEVTEKMKEFREAWLASQTTRKTAAVSGAPPEGLANSLPLWRRAAAPFALPKASGQ
jgi:predicted metalloprotease with PDZ domain